jgi:hypothetical protein
MEEQVVIQVYSAVAVAVELPKQVCTQAVAEEVAPA